MGVLVHIPVDFGSAAPSIVLLLCAVLAPVIRETREVIVKLDVVLNIATLPKLLRSVSGVVVGDQLGKRGAQGLERLGR